MMPVFRPDTDDEPFWKSIYTDDQYSLPKFRAEDVFLDIGCWIGPVTCKAHDNGSRNIYSYEACPENFALAQQNTAGLDGVHLYHTAVVGSFRPKKMPFPVGNNSFFIPEHEPQDVKTTTLDEILTEIGKPIRYLKIDVEGSEWEILYTCTMLDRVQEISGEYHQPCPNWHGLKQIEGLPGYDHLSLKAYLENAGFEVDMALPSRERGPHDSEIMANVFSAVRRGNMSEPIATPEYRDVRLTFDEWTDVLVGLESVDDPQPNTRRELDSYERVHDKIIQQVGKRHRAESGP